MKKLLIQSIVILIAGGLSLSASAADERVKAADDLDLRGSDCILIRTIRDYTPLDDRNLLIWGPAKRGYYVTLFRPAFGMRSSFRLGFSSRDDQLCPYGGDAVVFGGLGSDSIPVSSISRISADQVEQLLIRYGRKAPAEDQTQAPGKVQGAKVEELD